MMSITLATWKQKHSVCGPPVPFQHHPVLVHGHGAKGVAVRRRFNHAFERQVVYAVVPIEVVTAVVVMSGNVTHDAAVRTDDGQELLVVPDQAAGLSAVWVHWEVTWARTEKARQTDATGTSRLSEKCIYICL